MAIAQAWDVGATTVSASLALAAAAGVAVFATGGIGGVHRGADQTGDVSSDLDAIAHHPVVTVCAGAKAFLDLPRTLEYLETAGVPVLGWRHDCFPAFYTRSSGLSVPHRVESADEVAAVLSNRSRPETGVLLTVPIPEADELDADELDAVVEQALADAGAARSTGPAVTPFVLARIAEATAGRSIPANLALAEHNAAVAAEVASAVSAMSEANRRSRGLRFSGREALATSRSRASGFERASHQRGEQLACEASPDIQLTGGQGRSPRGIGDVPRISPLRNTVTGPSSLTTMTVAGASS